MNLNNNVFKNIVLIAEYDTLTSLTIINQSIDF